MAFGSATLPLATREPLMPEANAAGPGLAEVRRLRVKDYLNAVAWNFDGSRLAGLSGFGHTITVWDAASWLVVNEFSRYSGGYSFNSLAYLPNGTLLTSAPVGKSPDPKYETLGIFSLLQWDPESGRVIRHIPEPIPNIGFKISNTDTFTVSTDGSLVAGIMEGSREGYVLVFETRNWTLSRYLVAPPTPTHPDSVVSIGFSPDGKELAVGTITGRVHVFDLADGKLRLSFVAYPNDVSCDAVSFSADARMLATGRGQVAVGAPDEGRTRLWQAASGEHIASLYGGVGSVTKLAWNESNLLAASYNKSLLSWNGAETPPVSALEVSEQTFCVAFSRAGTLAATHRNEIALYR